jgi:broad specificity polyphosphatase/5'/3'-nucleotidase SurE
MWEGAAAVAQAVVGALASGGPGEPVVVNVNVPNLGVEAMGGWRHTTIGRIPPRVIAEVNLEPKAGHPGAFRVSMKWGESVSLPEGTDGGAVERDLVSVTLLSPLSEARLVRDNSAVVAAEARIAVALDALVGSA